MKQPLEPLDELQQIQLEMDSMRAELARVRIILAVLGDHLAVEHERPPRIRVRS